MFAVVVRESGEPEALNASGQHLETNVIPRVRQGPGFVTALWMTDRSGHTLNVLVFESEDAARAALERVRSAPRPNSLHLDSADIHQVLAKT